MKKGILWGTFLLISLSVLLAPQPGGQAAACQAQSYDTTIQSNVFYLIQGESASSDAAPPSDEFYALHIISYSLPYNQSRVYTSVPRDPNNLTVWTVFQGGGVVEHGWEASGPYADSFYVDVPSSHIRTATTTNSTDTAQDFLALGSQLVNLTYSSGSLHLTPGDDSGSYVSAPVPLPDLVTINSANLTFYGSSLGNISSEVSNDGGITWVACSNGTEATFPSNGTSLLVRFLFDGNSTLGYDPLISKYEISARYVTPISTFTIHISYSWTQEFVDDKAVLNLTEPLPYSSHGSFLVMLHVLSGYSPEGVGFDLIWDESREINTDPDRELYYNSTLIVAGSPEYSLEVSKASSSAWTLYAAVAVVLVVLAVGLVAIKRRKKAPSPAPSTDVQKTESYESVLAALAKLDEDFESGRLPENTYKTIRKEYVDKAAQLLAAREATGPVDQKTRLMEAILALDEEHERGDVADDVYKSLSASYRKELAEVMRKMDESGGAGE